MGTWSRNTEAPSFTLHSKHIYEMRAATLPITTVKCTFLPSSNKPALPFTPWHPHPMVKLGHIVYITVMIFRDWGVLFSFHPVSTDNFSGMLSVYPKWNGQVSWCAIVFFLNVMGWMDKETHWPKRTGHSVLIFEYNLHIACDGK